MTKERPPNSGSQENKANYTHASYDYMINHINQVDETIATIIVKAKNLDYAMATHRSKVTLQGAPYNSPPIGTYNVIDQLKKILAQISIFELLSISPTHKVILDKYLCESTIPCDIDENSFQAMVGNLVIIPCVTFTQQYIPTHKPSHNDPLHLEVFVHKHKIKRVLIDGGASLNICISNLVKALG